MYTNHCKVLTDNELKAIYLDYMAWRDTGIITPKTLLSVLRDLYYSDDPHTALLQLELDYLREYIDRDIKRKGDKI